MSFNEVRLPERVIADLYRSSLVGTCERPGTTNKESSFEPLQYLGENRRNTIVLVHYPQEQHLPVEHLAFLTNILKACSLEIADIAIINTAYTKSNLEGQIKALTPKAILLFGAQQLAIMDGADMINFNIVDVGGMMVASAPSLEMLSKGNDEAKLLKRQLWECLKKLFNI